MTKTYLITEEQRQDIANLLGQFPYTQVAGGIQMLSALPEQVIETLPSVPAKK